MVGLQSKFQNLNTKVNQMWTSDGQTDWQTVKQMDIINSFAGIALQSGQKYTYIQCTVKLLFMARVSPYYLANDKSCLWNTDGPGGKSSFFRTSILGVLCPYVFQ